MTWPSRAIGEVGVEVLDCDHRTPPAAELGYPYIAIPEIRDGRIHVAESRRITEEQLVDWTRRTKPQIGDVIVTRRGRVGDTAPIPVNECAIGQNLVLLRSTGRDVDQTYLRWATRSPQWWDAVDKWRNVGAVFSSLNVRDISRMAIPVPPLPTQRAIAEVLGALDDKIAANQAFWLKVEAVMSAEFTRLQRLDTSEPVSVTDLVEFNPRCSVARGIDVAYVDMQKLPTRGSEIESWSTRPAVGGARFANGDSLLARITPCLENRKTGYVDFLKPGETAVGSTEFIVLRTRSGYANPLGFLIAIDEGFRAHAIQHMVGTSGRQRVSAADLANYEFRLPHRGGGVQALGRRAEVLFGMAAAYRDENRKLAELRDTLLPHLMSGRITVRDAESRVEQAL